MTKNEWDLFCDSDNAEKYNNLLLKVQALKARVSTARFKAENNNRQDAFNAFSIVVGEIEKILDEFDVQ